MKENIKPLILWRVLDTRLLKGLNSYFFRECGVIGASWSWSPAEPCKSDIPDQFNGI